MISSLNVARDQRFKLVFFVLLAIAIVTFGNYQNHRFDDIN